MEETIARLTALGLIKGRGNGELALSGTLTRAELVTLLVRAFGSADPTNEESATPAFSDTAGHWADSAIRAALAIVQRNGETLGYPDGSFNPDATLTVAETIAFLMKFVGVKPDTSKPWPASHIDAAVNAGLVPPEIVDPERLADPNQPAVRGELFTLLDDTFSDYQLPSGKTVYTEYVDPEPPVVDLDPIRPSDSGTTTISGRVSEGTFLYINGEQHWVDAGPFSFEVTLPEGTAVVDVRAVDLVGNEAAPPAQPEPEPPAEAPADPPANPPTDPPATPPSDPPANPPTTPPTNPPTNPPDDPPDDPPVQVATHLTTEAAEIGTGNPVELKAKLTLADSTPLSNQTIRFYVNTTLVGSARTSETGNATFTYQASLPIGTYPLEARFSGSTTRTASTATSTLTIFPVPVASDMAVTAKQAIPLKIMLTATDATGGPSITFIDGAAPAHGTLADGPADPCTTTDGETTCTQLLTYTPNDGFTGADSFTYRAANGYGSSVTYTVAITVEPYTGPIPDSATFATAEDSSAATITLSGADPEKKPLTFAITGQPAHGTIGALSSPSCDPATGVCTATVDYTPGADYTGPDSIRFTVTNDLLTSPAATVSISVTPVNDAPTAAAVSGLAGENSTGTITLRGSDIDSASLTFTVVDAPQHGAVGPIDPAAVVCTPAGAGTDCTLAVTYAPEPNFEGTDRFTYTVGDAALVSVAAEATVTVIPLPVADDATANTAEDTAVTLEFTATDGEKQPLTFSFGAPSSGSLSGTAEPVCDPATGICTVIRTYTPAQDDNGAATISFTAADGARVSEPGTVTINISPVNDAPTAAAVSGRIGEDAPGSVTLRGSDIDSTSLTFAVANAPQHGTVSPIDPTAVVCTPAGKGSDCTLAVTYTPEPGYEAGDSFTYTVSDGEKVSAAAEVTVSVIPLPVADDATAGTAEDTAVTLEFTATDGEKQPLSFSIGAPSSGSLSGTAEPVCDPATGKCTVTRTYTPAQDYSGQATISFTAADGARVSAPATMTVTISPVNDRPVAHASTYTVAEDGAPITLALTGSDLERQPLRFSVGSQQTGYLDISGGPSCDPETGVCTLTATYTPVPNWYGTDSFTFTVKDQQLTSTTATVTITVTPVNDAPVAQSVATPLAVDEDTPVNIDLVATDIDDADLTFSGSADHGVVTLQAKSCVPVGGGNTCTQTVTYTPNEDYVGGDTIRFTVKDAAAATSSGTIALTVNLANDAPVSGQTVDSYGDGQAVGFAVPAVATTVVTSSTYAITVGDTP